MTFRALLEKDRDPVARIANPAPELLQLRFQKFVLGLASPLRRSRLQREQRPVIVSATKSGCAHAILAAFPEIAAFVDRAKNWSGSSTSGGEGHAGGVARDREKAFAACARCRAAGWSISDPYCETPMPICREATCSTCALHRK